jgi:predicted  nucleic acid-binding Zn-ribbon protein
MNDNEPQTIEQIQGTIKAARDSVFVVNDTLQQLENGKTPNRNRKSSIESNVGHLKIVVSDTEISESGEDIQDLHDAIAAGEAKLAEDIWPADTDDNDSRYDDREPQTIEQIQGTIKAARDSVFVVNDTLQQLENGKTPNRNRKSSIESNVGHLKIVVSDTEISESGEDIQDLYDAITAGEAKLAEDIWPADTDDEI